MTTRHRADPPDVRAPDPGARTRRPHVLDERLFGKIVVRERKRADRSDRPFVLLLLELPARPAAGCEQAITALVEATRDTDILGWFERHAVLGVIVTELGASDRRRECEELVARVRGALARRLDGDTMSRLSIRLHAHPEGEPGPGDPLLYPRPRPVRARDAMKRGLDVVASLALLLVLLPLLFLIAVLVKSRSRGPVLFRQVRIGHMMRPFTMLKFRTMSLGADPKLHRDFVRAFINGSGAAPEPNTNRAFKLTDDPRVTPIGRILRKTSLDELPQLWNVLRGEMSLVGPRPPLPYELEQYKPWHRRRVLDAKPGLTGLWQVTGRSRTTFDEMVRLDLRYARAHSLWTDIKILLATPAAAISGRGAW